jgi:hypothetical protein
MRIRGVLNVVLGLILGSVALYVMFPRFHNDLSCENSVPMNSAQKAGFADARSRKEHVCSGAQTRCVFAIRDNDDGSFRVRLYFVESDFFDGCVFKEQDGEELEYSRDGIFVGIEEAPYAVASVA